MREGLVVDVIRHPIPETERESGLSHDLVFELHVVEAEARECRHFACDGDAVADFIFVFRRLESHLEGRTFVFLNTNRCRVMLADDVKISIDAVGRDGETAAPSTEFIGGDAHRVDGLHVRIDEAERGLVVRHHLLGLRVSAIHDAAELHRLSRTVDGTVGEDLGLHREVVVHIALVVFEKHCRHKGVAFVVEVDVVPGANGAGSGKISASVAHRLA